VAVIDPPAFSIVIPMFNERAGATRCVERISLALEGLGGDSYFVVVDDGSTDGTGMLIDEMSLVIPLLRVVHHENNQGYGAALRTGARIASQLGAEWALFMDSDLTNPPEDIAKFLEQMTSDVDYVKASRYIERGHVIGVPLWRRAVSLFANVIARHAFNLPLTDLTNGFRAMRLETFLELPLQENGFPIILEEAYWASRKKLRCAEIATTLTNRGRDMRGSSFIYSPRMFYLYGRYLGKAVVYRVWSVLAQILG